MNQHLSEEGQLANPIDQTTINTLNWIPDFLFELDAESYNNRLISTQPVFAQRDHPLEYLVLTCAKCNVMILRFAIANKSGCLSFGREGKNISSIITNHDFCLVLNRADQLLKKSNSASLSSTASGMIIRSL